MSWKRGQAFVRVAGIVLLMGLVAALGEGGIRDVTVSGKVKILVQGVVTTRPQADASGVVLWLDGENSRNDRTPPRRSGQSILRQKNVTFIPRTLAIPVGEQVLFPNEDAIFHNVFSLSMPRPFDLGLYKVGKVPKVVFHSPGVWRIFCNIHSRMVAFIYVFDQPYFTATKRDGTFEIASVRPGRYRVMYSYGAKPARVLKTIDLKAGARVKLNFQLKESDFQIRSHPDKFGRSYKAPPI